MAFSAPKFDGLIPQPAQPKPKTGGVPWYLDLNLFDYVTKTLKVPVGPFRIRLSEDNEPLGGVELAPGAALPPPKGPPVGPQPPGRERFDTIEQTIIAAIKAVSGATPTDEELAMLTVVAGYKPNRLPTIKEPTPKLTPEEVAERNKFLSARSFLALDSDYESFIEEAQKELTSGKSGPSLLTQLTGIDLLTVPVDSPLAIAGEKIKSGSIDFVRLALGKPPAGADPNAPFHAGPIPSLFAAGEAFRGVAQSTGFGITEPIAALAGLSGVPESITGKIRGATSREIAGESLLFVLPVTGFRSLLPKAYKAVRFAITDIPKIRQLGPKAWMGKKLDDLATLATAEKAKVAEALEDALIEDFAESIGASLKKEKGRDRLFRFARDPQALRDSADSMEKGRKLGKFGGPPGLIQKFRQLADQMEAVQGITRELPNEGQVATLEWLFRRGSKGAPKTITDRMKQAANDVGVKITDDAGQLRPPKDVFNDILGLTGDLPIDDTLQFWPKAAFFSENEWGQMIARAVVLRREVHTYQTVIEQARLRKIAAGRTPTEVVDNLRTINDFIDSLEGLGITEEGELFLRSLEGKQAPKTVTDRIRRIAKDNGVVVEKGMSAEDVGAALKAKRGELSTPSPARAAAAARAAGLSTAEIEARTVEQIIEEVTARQKRLQAINSAEIGAGGPTIPLASLIDALAKAELPPDAQLDIWRLLRFQLPGGDETARLTGIVRRAGTDVIEEAPNVASVRAGAEEIVAGFIFDEKLRRRAMPAVVESLEVVGSSPTKLISEMTKRMSAIFAGDLPIQGTALRSMTEQLAKWYGKQVKRLAKTDIGVTDPTRLVFTTTKGVVRELAHNRSFTENTRVLFGDSERLVDELQRAVDIPSDLGSVQSISPTERVKQLVSMVRKVKLPELQSALRGRTKGLPKPTRAVVKDARNKLKPAMAELRKLQANIDSTRDLNIRFEEEVARAASLSNVEALAKDPDLTRRAFARAQAEQMDSFVTLMKERLKVITRGDLVDAETLEAFGHITNPADVVLPLSADPRVSELAAMAPQRQRAAFANLFRITQPNELLTAGEQLASRSLLPVVGPLIQHVKGQFSRNPVLLGIFWHYQVARAVGGLTNTSHMGNLYRLARQLAPRKGGLSRLLEGERLETHLASKFADSPAARETLGLPASFSRHEDIVVDLYKRQFVAFLRNPELYPDIEEGFENLAKVYRALDDDLTSVSATMGIGTDLMVEASRESILDNSLRLFPNDTSLKSGIPMTWLDTIGTLAENKRFAGVELQTVVKTGRDLLIDIQGAKYRHILNRATIESIADLNVGTTATSKVLANTNDLERLSTIRKAQKRAQSDISVVNKKWSINKGLRDWPVEIQNDLPKLMDALTGPSSATGPLGFVQDVFRNVMMWRLVMDASIFGIQGSFYVAMRGFMRPGVIDEPVQMFDALRMFDDEHFIQWTWANQDELMAYFSNGLEVGLETMVGTATNRPLLIEYIPEMFSRLPGPIGRVAGKITEPLGLFGAGVRTFNDIMFDRWMLWMKTNLIRQHLDGIQILRRYRAGFASHMDDLLGEGEKRSGFGRVADELGGVEQLYLSSPEDTLRSVIRVVNQQLGGLPRSQTALSLWRETAESFLLFVPGFWRARLGLLNSAVTRPFSAEGQLALSAVVREHAFLGAFGALVSWWSGNLDRFNYTDPRKADFLAAQFNNDWMPMVPSAASSTRIMARIIGGINDVKDPKERLRALEILTSGRLHPILQSTYESFRGRDFLGNSLQGKKERFLNWAQQLTPIFTEQLAETIGRDEPTSPGDFADIATKGLAEFIGKNIIPRSPLSYLDEAAGLKPGPNGEQGRRWSEIGQVDQSELLGQLPDLEQHLLDYEDSLKDRSSSKELQQSERFDAFESTALETNSKLGDLGKQLDAGAVDDEDFRDGRRTLFDLQSGAFGRIEDEMLRDGFDPEESFNKRREPENKDKMDIVSQAVLDYRSVHFEDFERTESVETLKGPIEVIVPNFDEFDAARIKALDPYTADVQRAALEFIRRNEPPIETRFRTATNALDTYFNIPKYTGLTVKEGALLDTILGSFSAAGRRIRTEADIKEVDPTTATQTRILVAQQLLRSGRLPTARDRQILALALIMARKPEVKGAIVSPKKAQFVINNQDLSLFYGFTANDVPDELRHLLPWQVQQRFDQTFQESLEGRLKFIE